MANYAESYNMALNKVFAINKRASFIHFKRDMRESDVSGF